MNSERLLMEWGVAVFVGGIFFWATKADKSEADDH
jgi:hypothetical protein